MSNTKKRVVKLGDVVDFQKGKPLASHQVIKGKYGVVAGGTKINHFHNEYNAENCITVSSSGTAGHLMYHKNKKVFLTDCFSVFPKDEKELAKDFLFFFLQKNQERMYNLASGGGIPHFYPKDMEDFEIEIPESIEEQKRIAGILNNVDENIENIEREIKQLDYIKKQVVSEIFNKNEYDSLVIGESKIKVIEGDRGKNYPSENDYKEVGYCVFLNAKNVTKNGFSFDKVYFIDKDKDEILNRGKLKRNDICLTTRGTVGNMAFYNDKIQYKHIRINSGMVVIRNEEDGLLEEFLFNQLKEFIIPLKMEVVSGSVIKQLPSGEINKFEVFIPSIEEQIKVNKTIANFNDRIKTLEDVKNKLLNTKQGLLNKFC